MAAPRKYDQETRDPHQSRVIHIGIGRAHKGERILLLVADRDVRVVNENGEPIRQLTIGPSRDYQGHGLG